MAWTMTRVDSRRPPGVPREMMTRAGVAAGGFVKAALEVGGGDGLDGVVKGQAEN